MGKPQKKTNKNVEKLLTKRQNCRKSHKIDKPSKIFKILK